MKKMLMSTLVLLALTTTGSFASSDDHYKRMSAKDLFERLDQNDDGKISLAEYMGFAQLDKNNDGLLTYDEFKDSRKRYSKYYDDDDHYKKYRHHDDDDDHHKYMRR